MKIIKTVSIAFLFVLTSPALAQISITEIMYDAPGADTKREWIEIFNSGEGQVAIDSIRFIENNVRHTITGNNTYIPPQSYAIIASDVDAFLIDHSSFGGQVFDSVFSLSNEGEKLEIEYNNVITDTVVYVPKEQSSEKEMSLQKIGGEWKVGLSTPAVENFIAESAQEGSSATLDNTSGTNNSSSQSASKNIPSHASQLLPIQKVITRKQEEFTIGRERVGYPQVPLSFELMSHKSIEPDQKIVWSFGDGHEKVSMHKEGMVVKHMYQYPGTYVVTARLESDTHNGFSRTLVNVLDVRLAIAEIGNDYIAITNPFDYEVNIGGMQIVFNTHSFMIPQDTIVTGLNTIKLPLYLMGIMRTTDIHSAILTPPAKKTRT